MCSRLGRRRACILYGTTANMYTMNYTEKKFTLPELDGISRESVDAHLGLYAGYVKNFNGIHALMDELMHDSEKNMHALAELERRLSFEWGGMRLHELYFAQWEGGAHASEHAPTLAAALAAQYGSVETFLAQFSAVALMRGVGWAVLYYDVEQKTFHIGFSEQQHQGHFVTLPIILALDLWEHSFIVQFGTTGKKPYIEAFFKNVNWQVLEKRFADISR